MELDSRLLMIVQEYLSKEDVQKISGIIYEKLPMLRSDFPFYESFLKNTQAGEDIEVMLSDKILSGLQRVTGDNYDHVIVGTENRVEVKSIRMMSGDEKDTKYPAQRAISFFDKRRVTLSNSTFQQIKPAEFEYMIGILLYKDALSLYLVPSSAFHGTVLPKNRKSMKGLKGQALLEKQAQYEEYLRIKDDKIVLSGQHKDNLEEGQIGFAQLEKYLKLSIYPKEDKFFYIKDGKRTDEEFTSSIQDLI